MTTQTTQIQAANNGGQIQQKQQPKIDILKNILDADSVKKQFTNALGNGSSTFIASVIDLYNTDSKLQCCEPKQVVMEALKAAVLNLPINKSLGYAYIIPFNNTKKEMIIDKDGKEVEHKYKVLEPTFQMGYKGYIQLAMRTNQYRYLNTDVVYEGEIRQTSKLKGTFDFEGKKTSDKIVGYFCYFELIGGFSKTLYMTTEQMARHALRYSKGLQRGTTFQSLMALAAKPLDELSYTVGWNGNFHDMARKTVLRSLLSKYGYLSAEMRNAFLNDLDGETLDPTEQNFVEAQVVDESTVTFKQIGAAPVTNIPQQQAAPEPVEQEQKLQPGF